jgi:cobalt-zinc-cadmium efflux system membrane fusion protein
MILVDCGPIVWRPAGYAKVHMALPRHYVAWSQRRDARALAFGVAVATILGTGAFVFARQQQLTAPAGAKEAAVTELEVSSQSKRGQRYRPTEAQWAMLTVEPAAAQVFRAEHTTEGKISINEDGATPVFSPYAGRVTRLMVRPGEMVRRGQPLFFIEASDMVQAQNDFAAAVAGLNRARSRLTLTEIIEKQNRTLFESKAGSLREHQTAQADAAAARSEVRTAEAALEASRNRLALLGKTDDEIATFQDKGKINPETPIYAPIGGTVVQRKVGPGQYVSYTSTGSVDPVFTIGDLSTVWLVAYVRESEATRVRAGQQLEFTVLAHKDTVFKAKVDYVAASLDPTTRRLMIRAAIDNADGRFKPEMFASVTIITEENGGTLAVARDAVIFEADSARVWVALDDKSIELRRIKTGSASGKMIQVLDGLQPGEKVVTRGSLFVDKAASS